MLDFIRPNDKKSKNPSGFNEEAINNQSDKYYTLSKKGITTYYKDNPEGYEQIQDWLLARNNFQIIRNFKFFKNFRRWKILKNWRRNLIYEKRKEIEMALEEKLFVLDEKFGVILMQHRKNCIEMQQLRVVNLRWNNSEIGNLTDFLGQQERQQKYVTAIVKRTSDSSRNLF